MFDDEEENVGACECHDVAMPYARRSDDVRGERRLARPPRMQKGLLLDNIRRKFAIKVDAAGIAL